MLSRSGLLGGLTELDGLLLLASGTNGGLLGALDTLLAVAQLLALLARFLLDLVGESVAD